MHLRFPRAETAFAACLPASLHHSEALSEFTHILERVEHGDPQAAAELLPIVYEELRRLAAQKMANEAAGHTLQPTALVHEAWMRLGGTEAPAFQNRAHFFGAAAEAMRRILIEHARSHWDGVVAYLRTRITNGAAEALNGIIQTVKRKARGFRTVEYFTAMIYLVASHLKFNLPDPLPATHTKSY